MCHRELFVNNIDTSLLKILRNKDKILEVSISLMERGIRTICWAFVFVSHKVAVAVLYISQQFWVMKAVLKLVEEIPLHYKDVKDLFYSEWSQFFNRVDGYFKSL